MTDITNKEYSVIKCDEKGTPRFFYAGHEMWMEPMKLIFEWLQEECPEIEELHGGAFATSGEFAKQGNPSGDGPNGWCRVKFKNGKLGPWVFLKTYDSVRQCITHCAYFGVSKAYYREDFRDALLQNKTDVSKTQNVNESNTESKRKPFYFGNFIPQKWLSKLCQRG